MNGYQPSLVPQSAVTFGDERLVDPWAETMLRNACSNLQVQNTALQQENAALKDKNQSLQQQSSNQVLKVADRAYLREFSAYRTEHFVKFPRWEILPCQRKWFRCSLRGHQAPIGLHRILRSICV